MDSSRHAEPTRVILIIAGIFAVASIGILGYVLYPMLFGSLSGNSGQSKLPSLEEREQIVDKLNVTTDVNGASTTTTSVSQEEIQQRQKLLANLNPDQHDVTASTTTTPSQQKAAPKTDAERLQVYKAEQQETNDKLKVMQSLNGK